MVFFSHNLLSKQRVPRISYVIHVNSLLTCSEAGTTLPYRTGATRKMELFWRFFCYLLVYLIAIFYYFWSFFITFFSNFPFCFALHKSPLIRLEYKQTAGLVNRKQENEKIPTSPILQFMGFLNWLMVWNVEGELTSSPAPPQSFTTLYLTHHCAFRSSIASLHGHLPSANEFQMNSYRSRSSTEWQLSAWK